MKPNDSSANPSRDGEPDAAPPPTPRIPQTWEADDREQRLRALRDLAQQQIGATSSTRPAQAASAAGTSAASSPTSPPGPTAPSLAPPRRSRRSRRRPPLWLAGALVVLAVVVIVAGVVFFRGLRTSAPVAQRHISLALSINPASNLLACPVDVEWSPDGTRIAILGYHNACPNSDSRYANVSGQLDIYDATSGQLVASSQLDQQILPKGRLTLGPSTRDPSTGNIFNPFIAYTGLVWSPNSKYLAVPFVILNQPYHFPAPYGLSAVAPRSAPTWAGVWLTGPANSTELDEGQVLATKTTLDLNLMQRPAMEWDLSEDSLVPGGVSLPPALGYTWNPDGTLTADDPLAPDQAPPAIGKNPGPVGNSNSSQNVSIWQPGLASQGSYYPLQSGTPTAPGTPPPQPIVVSNIHLWYTTFALWSPDGRYLIIPVYYGGRVAIPGEPAPAPADLRATEQDQAAVLPVRDAAMQQIYRHYRAAWLAWRPDGKVLAALVSAGTGAGHSFNGFDLDLYSCASGRPLTTPLSIKPPAAGTILNLNLYGFGSSPDGIYLRWSPDGKRILLFNSVGDSHINVWNLTGF